MVDITERCLFLFLVFIFCKCQRINCETIEKTQAARQTNELDKQDKIDKSKVYSSPKAHEFLSYDKCMQRMKCPVSRKEDCSEECHAGNTEEEIEEYTEITKIEHRNALNKKPKSRIHTKIKTRLNKIKNISKTKQTTTTTTTTNSTNPSTIKTEL
ncbi:unnamed protein product [Rotaria sp. Silwood1]|nr:unnamed protein product [Rotaria sp. Silwood1]CAF3650898.1 unnamed protein product [Rotaria sp. Silwood1]CAF3689030.1 unnamed protein product [Rotaria sp. Silwood1]CAF4757618.1 unnamed protein product [Rotaria sp. Silwood1]CAF4960104.1 unnamed protein product [Rotaria sp. Silwood1]